MDADAFFNRLKQRVAELERSGKRIPPDIKKTIRQRPQHGYRLDSIERLAEALDWSVPELLSGIWHHSGKFSQNTVPHGLRRHAVCLNYVLKSFAPNPLMSLPPELEERRLENLVAENYRQWIEYEKACGRPVTAEEIIYFWEQVERRAAEISEERWAAEASSPLSEQPDDLSAPEKKAVPDDKPPLAA